MEGELYLRRGRFGFYIFGETWVRRTFALRVDEYNPSASVFGAVSGPGRPVHIDALGWVAMGEVTSVRPVVNGKFMDEQGTMLTCTKEHAFEITFTRGPKSSKYVFSAPDDTKMRTWVAVLVDAVRRAKGATSQQMGYPARSAEYAGHPASGVWPGAFPAQPPPASQSLPPTGYYGYPQSAAPVDTHRPSAPSTAYPQQQPPAVAYQPSVAPGGYPQQNPPPYSDK